MLLAELLHIELECRRRAGESPALGDYLALFPANEELLREVFAEASLPDTGNPTPTQETASLPIPGAGRGGVPGYEMLEELGRGGMGVVHKARHLALNRLVALKFILAGRHAHARHLERFRREAEAVARLRHPNIVQIYDIGEADGQCYLALEYGDGGNLRDRLAGNPLEPRSAARLLEPIARAVQHAHRQGVIHRDLKPANVVLAAGGDSIMPGHRPLPEFQEKAAPGLPPLSACTPKLTDFGLARLMGDDGPLTEFGVAAGTPSYMAPEQATGTAEPGPAADVWALGATLYECLTGRPPFKAATAVETLRLVAEADPVPPSRLQPSVPRDLETICLKCLAKEQAKRYAGARELAQDLQRFLQGEPIQARRAGLLERLWRWAKRRPGTAALVALLLATVLAGTIGIAWAMLYAFAGWKEAARNEGQARAAPRTRRGGPRARPTPKRARRGRPASRCSGRPWPCSSTAPTAWGAKGRRAGRCTCSRGRWPSTRPVTRRWPMPSAAATPAGPSMPTPWRRSSTAARPWRWPPIPTARRPWSGSGAPCGGCRWTARARRAPCTSSRSRSAPWPSRPTASASSPAWAGRSPARPARPT